MLLYISILTLPGYFLVQAGVHLYKVQVDIFSSLSSSETVIHSSLNYRIVMGKRMEEKVNLTKVWALLFKTNNLVSQGEVKH